MALVLAGVLLFSGLVYLPSTQYAFVWDDQTLITGNQLLANSRPLDFFTRGFWAGSPDPVEGPGAAYYRPLTTLTFWLDWNLGHGRPAWFHAVNLVLNALAAVAVTLVLWELLHSGVWALLGGLLFGAHSAHVESVAFVSGRTDVLAGLFLGIAAFGLLRALRKKNRWWWFAVLPGFALSLLAKETAILFPVLVLLAPAVMLVRFDRRHWLLVAAAVAVAAGYLYLRSLAVPVPVALEGRVGLMTRLLGVANTFGLYVRTFFWPFLHRAKYPANSTLYVPSADLLATILFAVTVPLLALKRRFRVSLWGYAWTIAFLLPVTNIASIGPLAAERLLYIPSAGIIMVVVTALSRLVSARALLRQTAALALVAAVVLLAADSVSREKVWENNETLFTAMVKEARTAPSAYANLADALVAFNPDSAVRLYDKAISLDQGYVHAHLNVATVYSRRQDHRRALHHLRIARELKPASVQVLNNLGLAFMAAGEGDSALAALDQGLRFAPDSPLLHLNRGSALSVAGRSEEARAEFSRALELDSSQTEARVMLAEELKREGRPESAAGLMMQVVAKQPSPAYLNRLGSMLVASGDSSRAEQCYLEALRRDSAFVPALYNQAILYAARGESARARTLAGRAFRLRPDLEAVKSVYLGLGGQ
jgi:tetratricopeptide (TPR) repeat protein